MNGFLLIDKEQDWTSSDVVSKLRGILREKRVGHAGTLDPMATGLLIIMVGKSTKASDYIMHQDKEYVATLKLGISTDTQDIWGNVISKKEVNISRQQFDDAIKEFIGDIKQIPPMYSAIKIHGEKLYNIARRGEEIEREPRNVRINSIEVLSFDGDEVRLKVRCSSGTYVRTLCHDIGNRLGCGACMSDLRRTKIGKISVDDAHRISAIKDGEYLLSPINDIWNIPEKVLTKIMRENNA